MDINTFSPLVEASALDLHCYIVQCNNRTYGDSRIRAPFAESYHRDVVRLKGGISDYYVMAEIDYKSLREAQRKAKSKPKKSSLKTTSKPLFKPVPIGYRMSKMRFNKG